MSAAVARTPLPLLQGFAPLFSWGVRRGLRATRFRAALILTVLLGALVGYSGRFTPDPTYHLWHSLEAGLLGIVVPLVALGVVGGGYGEEVQEQTLVYHLVRPVSRSTMFLARFVAGALPGMLAAAVVAVGPLLVSKVQVPVSVIISSALIFGAGAALVGAIYYTLAATFQRGLVAGLIYTFVVEGLFQFLPGSIQNLSLMHHVRSLFHHAVDSDFAPLSARIREEIARRSGVPRGFGDKPEEMLFRRAAQEPWTGTGTAILICLVVAAAVLAIGVRVVRRRDFALKD
jgi:ABC-type transport system involved in multi-copper enzyme maturation permease subunit